MLSFVDDSDMSAEGPVGILAGWVASSATWEAFSEDWKREVLGWGGKTIEVFKPTTRDLRNEFEKARLKAAMDVLARHNPLGVITSIPHAAHKEAFKDVVGKPLRSPYYLAFNSLAMLLSKHLSAQEQAEPVDFIFDHQPGQEEAVTANWAPMRASLPPEQQRLLKTSPPKFESDKDVLPLQAAHLLAWNMRRVTSDKAAGRVAFWFPWPEKIRYAHWVWTADLMRMAAEPLVKAPHASRKRRRRQRDGEG